MRDDVGHAECHAAIRERWVGWSPSGIDTGIGEEGPACVFLGTWVHEHEALQWAPYLLESSLLANRSTGL